MRQPRRIRVAIALLATVAVLQGAREIKPGFNLFSKDQDVQLGREAAQQVEKEVRVVRDSELQNYISQLGSRLAKASQAPEYPYTFKVVAEKGINAFALPGGPIYVHAATIAAADNEAQLAGVMAHEIAHVGLRHSTNQVSKAYAWQIPLALAGGALGGGGSLLGQLAQLGVGLGVNSVMLKYSRDAERDADLVGARTMANAGYDPIEMARFFEKLESQGGGNAIQFLSDHPNPGNRIKYVQEEVASLPRRQYSSGSANFSQIRNLAARVPASDSRRGYADQPQQNHPHPEFPSGEFREFRGQGFTLRYPSNWKAYAADNAMGVTIAPEQGLVQASGGQVQIGLGAIAGYFSPDTNDPTAATDELVQDLRAKNPDLRAMRGQRQRTTVNGSAGESMLLVGTSPLGNQREVDWLLTAVRPNGLFYLVLIAPESDFNSLQPTFRQMQNSVRFLR